MIVASFIIENNKLKISRLAFEEFNLNHFNMFLTVHIKSSLILGRSSPHGYIVLSSAKLQGSDFSTKNKISLMNILNNNGPNIEPCGIPRKISDRLLYEKPTLVLYFFKLS